MKTIQDQEENKAFNAKKNPLTGKEPNFKINNPLMPPVSKRRTNEVIYDHDGMIVPKKRISYRNHQNKYSIDHADLVPSNPIDESPVNMRLAHPPPLPIISHVAHAAHHRHHHPHVIKEQQYPYNLHQMKDDNTLAESSIRVVPNNNHSSTGNFFSSSGGYLNSNKNSGKQVAGNQYKDSNYQEYRYYSQLPPQVKPQQTSADTDLSTMGFPKRSGADYSKNLLYSNINTLNNVSNGHSKAYLPLPPQYPKQQQHHHYQTVNLLDDLKSTGSVDSEGMTIESESQHQLSFMIIDPSEASIQLAKKQLKQYAKDLVVSVEQDTVQLMEEIIGHSNQNRIHQQNSPTRKKITAKYSDDAIDENGHGRKKNDDVVNEFESIRLESIQKELETINELIFVQRKKQILFENIMKMDMKNDFDLLDSHKSQSESKLMDMEQEIQDYEKHLKESAVQVEIQSSKLIKQFDESADKISKSDNKLKHLRKSILNLIG